jgi:hypothetical protein
MLFKILTCVLVVLLVAETAYILAHRSGSKRFRMTEENAAIVLDTATGLLCKAFETKPVESTDTAETVFLIGLPTCSRTGVLKGWFQAGRFQPFDEDEYAGRIAWDVSSGRMCRTVKASLLESYATAKAHENAARRAEAQAKAATETDPISAEIERLTGNSTADQQRPSFERSLPSCSDVR